MANFDFTRTTVANFGFGPTALRAPDQIDAFLARGNRVDHSVAIKINVPMVMHGVKTLIEYLEAGDRLNDFLEDFPTVTRDQALRVLEMAKEALLAASDETTS